LFVRTRCLYDKIVYRMLRSLLKRDSHYAAGVSEFAGAVADEEMREVLDRDLPLKGDPATARRVGAHARRASVAVRAHRRTRLV